jgi:hypothetical protein
VLTRPKASDQASLRIAPTPTGVMVLGNF